VHRDIKLDNILIYKIENGDLNVKIADLGLAVQFEDALTAKSGTPGYMAPEILRDEDYTEIVDIFSLGVVFFNILTCMYLFKG
jgi:serine/threonine protein kinase